MKLRFGRSGSVGAGHGASPGPIGGFDVDLGRRLAPATAGLAVAGHERVEVDQRADLLGHAVGHPAGRRPPRPAVLLGAVGGVALALYGGVLVLVGALALAGVTGAASDRFAVRWHVCCWDLWFLLWGVALALAATRARQRARDIAR